MPDNNVEDKDILEIFKTAVRNGQTRLALEALVDVIDAIVEIIAPSEEQQQPTEQKQEKEQPQVVEESKEEKPSSKKKTKEETTAAISE